MMKTKHKPTKPTINYLMSKLKLGAKYQLLTLFVLGVSQAATINVTSNNATVASDGDCSISEAIQAANTNLAVNECIAGDNVGGNDTIVLESDIVLTTEFENHASLGRTGIPAITTNIVIDGSGHTIERDSSLSCSLNLTEDAGEFRLLRIANPGNLELNNVILKNGCADGVTTDSKLGGAILNFSANLTLSNSIIENNKAEFRGGGVDTTFGISVITNSYFANNKTNFGGGALSNFTSTTNINNSTFDNNTAGNRGGAIWNIDGVSVSDQNATITLINNTFSGNYSRVKTSKSTILFCLI